MPVTMKQLTRELNHLEKVRGLFPANKMLSESVVQVQLLLATSLVETLKYEEQRLSKEFNDVEIGAMISRDKVKGIKSLRERVGMGLVEAKQYFEDGCVRLGYARWRSDTITPSYKVFEWK